MFCLRKGAKPTKDNVMPVTNNSNSTNECLADNNATFLRAARAGNLEKVLEYLKGNIDINTSNANGLNALHLAAKEGHVDVVTELLKRGANVNAATKKGNTALHIASLAGQEEVVKVLANLGANVNVQSQNGFTPLYMAAQENHDVVVSFLLANGANQSLATEDGFTPLAVALQQGHDKVVAVLLENDTKGRVRLPALHIAAKKDDCKAATLLLQNDHNPDVTSKSGFTPLHIAAHYGNEKIANILLDKGADVNYAAKHQITPLHVASKWGKSNMVDLLLQKGANIEAATRDGLTPLHCAARSGHDQVVDLLLEKGAPILAKTKNGLAPLHMASQGDHVDSARILLYHKAPVDDVTVDYLTALHVAAHCGHVKVAKLLLDRKADPNARALNGFTPLHIACKKNRIKIVELLLKHGASIEATTESGLSPLHVASFMGCMNIVIYLIQSGANPDVPTVRGETPLHLAARANQIDIIRILLRNGANVDARAREEQTPLHIAARLGNVDIVSLLLQHGAAVDATTKDMYTALHIASKEGQEEVVSVLLDHEASLTAVTKRGFTPLHLAAKYGNIKVVRLLLQKDAPVDAQGKNGLTPLHVAAHYNHVNEALLLLEKGASPHAAAKNGFTPLHIASKKNQMDIATTLLEYGAKCNAESKAGYTPLHLSSQEGHTDMTTLLIEHQANVNSKANNGLTPLHLAAQEDQVNVASILVRNGAEVGPQTNAGYTPLHVASHFGQINMVRFLLQNHADVHTTTEHGYTPLHQAAQQGHTPVVNVLLEYKASPNTTTLQGQTALSIAQRLGYISVVETLKVVTETTVTTTTTTVTEEKYKVVSPEIMQETFMTDSEDEGGEDTMLGDQSYRYLTADEMKSLGDDSLPIDVTKDEKQHEAIHMIKDSAAPMVEEDKISPQHITPIEVGFSEKFSPDNIDISHAPVHAGFLVSFMVDARGGAMRGCRHSGVRVIIPPRKASMPMRITCRYLRKEKLIHPPPLMEGEACASRILEVGPVGARFLGPVILEVPHFASLRGREREVTILRSDTGETWREHSLEASEEAVQDVLNESFEGDELSALEDLNTNRITRILTTDFPQYFAIVTRIRQEVHGVGPEGGIVSSKVVPQVQAIFPEGALQKKIRVGLQAQPIAPELVTKMLGNRVAVSPIVTVEPRRRKFHKPISLTIPVPQAATKGMINQYSGDAPTLRLLCSITGSTKSGGSSKAQWEDVTGSTPLTFVNDCVSFTTTVSARFWLMDCRQVSEVSKFATELYQEAVHVPFMAKFVIFAKRHDPNEAQLRVFCMTDDKEDKTLETQEHFTEIAKSRDVEVLEGKLQHLEFAGNLVPVTNSKEQLKFVFHAFHENRLPFTIRVKDPHMEPLGRIAFMKEPKVSRGEPPQTPICNLNVAMPEVSKMDQLPAVLELVTLEKKYDFMQEAGLSKPEFIHRANLRLSDIARELDKDWVALAHELHVSEYDINGAKSQYPDDINEQALAMLRVWFKNSGSKVSGNELEKGLRKINREDIIKKCMFNVELVTDDVEKAVAKVHLDQSGFDVFKEELGSSREASMRRGASLDISYDEQDIMKEAESAAETSSETGSLFERDQMSQSFPEDKENHVFESHDKTPASDIHNSELASALSENVSLVNHNDEENTEFQQARDLGVSEFIAEVKLETASTDQNEQDIATCNEINVPLPMQVIGMTQRSEDEITSVEVEMQYAPPDSENTNGVDMEINLPMQVIGMTQRSEDEATSADVQMEYAPPDSENTSGVDIEINNKHDLNVNTIMESSNECNSQVSVVTLHHDNTNLYDSHHAVFASEMHDNILSESAGLKGVNSSVPKEQNISDVCDVHSIKDALPEVDYEIRNEEQALSNVDILELSNPEENENTEIVSSCLINNSEVKHLEEETITVNEMIQSSTNLEDHIDAESRVFILNNETDGVFSEATFEKENSMHVQDEKDFENPLLSTQFSDTFAMENVDESVTPLEIISSDMESTDISMSQCPPMEDKEISEISVISSQLSDVFINENVEESLPPSEITVIDLEKSNTSVSSTPQDYTCSTKEVSNAYSSVLRDNTYSSDYSDEHLILGDHTQIAVEVVEDQDTAESEELCSNSGELAETTPECNAPLQGVIEGNLPPSTELEETECNLEENKIHPVAKTPPPSPADVCKKDEEVTTEFIPDEAVLQITTMPVLKPIANAEIPHKMTESETWPSGEMDTSQVSVSSLPDDEKSEQTTTPVSSTFVEPEHDKVQERMEWTEVDPSGTVKHVIQKTTHMTLCMQQKSDDAPEEEGSFKTEDDEKHLAYLHSPDQEQPKSSADEDESCVLKKPEVPEMSTIISEVTSNIIEGSSDYDVLAEGSNVLNTVKDISEECLEISKVPEVDSSQELSNVEVPTDSEIVCDIGEATLAAVKENLTIELVKPVISEDVQDSDFTSEEAITHEILDDVSDVKRAEEPYYEQPELSTSSLKPSLNGSQDFSEEATFTQTETCEESVNIFPLHSSLRSVKDISHYSPDIGYRAPELKHELDHVQTSLARDAADENVSLSETDSFANKTSQEEVSTSLFSSAENVEDEPTGMTTTSSRISTAGAEGLSQEQAFDHMTRAVTVSSQSVSEISPHFKETEGNHD